MSEPIYVTRPYLPPLEELQPYLEAIWGRRILTNGGPYHQELERKLCEHLGVKYISLFSNATIALLVALRALDIKGEVITTPFSFVATAHSILWNGLTPVFADIDPTTLNLSPAAVERAISPATEAVLGVHVYGTPCDTENFAELQKSFGLKIVYDAAHAFGVQRHGRSVLLEGDLSVLSFHATKTYNTFEGGAIVCHDEIIKRKIDQLKNFGFQDETTILATGINGKMNELLAAVGLLQLKHVDTAIEKRKMLDDFYRKELSGTRGISFLNPPFEVKQNYSYFPILVDDDYGLSREELYERLKEANVYTRRYFYPLISSMPMYKHLPSANPQNLPVAQSIADRILCLPIYPELNLSDARRIAEFIKASKAAIAKSQAVGA